MNEFDRPPHEIADPLHEVCQDASVLENQERLITRRPITEMKSELDIIGDSRT